MFGSYFVFSCKKPFSKSTGGGRFAQPMSVMSAIVQKTNCAFKITLPAAARSYTQLQRPVE